MRKTASILFSFFLLVTVAQSTPFTYQGHLADSNGPINGNVDLLFRLLDAADPNDFSTHILGSNQFQDVTLEDGVFTVTLDFQPFVFDGNAYWLEISVRPGGTQGGYTQLLPTQAIQPAPEAQVALSLAANSVTGAHVVDGSLRAEDVDSSSIQLRVNGSCAAGSAIRSIAPDGSVTCEVDDDAGGDITGVIAGFGLSGGGDAGEVSLSVDSSIIQRRVSNGCAAGSSIRSIAMDGSVVCETDDVAAFSVGEGLLLEGNTLRVGALPWPSDQKTTIDNNGAATTPHSAIVGSDGLTVISYQDANLGALKVHHCNDLACTSGTTTVIDSGNGVSAGTYSSITLGKNGFPLISHYRTGGGLLLTRCQDVRCSNHVTSVLDESGNVGQWTSITTNPQGYALISYYDVDNGDLKILSCNDEPCSSPQIWLADSTGNVGQYSSIVRGIYDTVYVAYYDATGGNLKMARCSAANCATPALLTLDGLDVPDVQEEDVGQWASINLLGNGLPAIVYNNRDVGDSSNFFVYFLRCLDYLCSTTSVQSLLNYATFQVVRGTSISTGLHGAVVLSYTVSRTGINRCMNYDCSERLYGEAPALSVGGYALVSLNSEGLPLHIAQLGNSLVVEYCMQNTCLSNLRTR